MMVVRKKSIRIVWRDGFFLYLCSEINNNKLTELSQVKIHKRDLT